MTPKLKAAIKKWCKEYKETYPSNLQVDFDDYTLESWAYGIFMELLAPSKISSSSADHPARKKAIRIIEEVLEPWVDKDIEGEEYYKLEDELTNIIK